MSRFPRIRPSSRSFTPGVVPVGVFASMSGRETRVITGDSMHGHTVSLTFSNILEPTVKLIVDHWKVKQGTALSFRLPSDVWAGWSLYTDAVDENQQWRYVEQPEISSVSPGVLSVTVNLLALA